MPPLLLTQRSRADLVQTLSAVSGDAQLLSRLGLATLAVLALCFGADSGVTYDEPLHHEYGERILAWYGSGFHDQRVLNYPELHLYGGLFDVLAQLWVRLLPWGPYEVRHLLTALVAVLGVVGTARIAARVGGPWAGFWSGFLLALTPAWVGHGLFNPKDVPFAVASVFVTLAAMRLVQGALPPRWRDVLWAGVAVGVGLAVRPGGLFLLLYPCLACASCTLRQLRQRARSEQPLQLGRASGGLLVRCALIAAVAWSLMLIAWPWALLSPLARPLEALRAATHYAWQGNMLFRGQMVDSHALPWSYLPTWFVISLPELYIVAALCGLMCLGLLTQRRSVAPERALGLGMIAVSVLVPFGAVLLLHPVLYDAQRHFLFLYPPLAALSGIALARVLHGSEPSLRLKQAVVLTLLVLAGAVARDMIQLHPYEYVYFNRSSGGLRHAVGRYETDYWGASYREALAWVVARADELGGGRPVRVAACDDNANERLQYYVARWPGAAARVRITPDYQHADLFLAVTRDLCHTVPGSVLHEVRRQQAPLAYVIRASQR